MSNISMIGLNRPNLWHSAVLCANGICGKLCSFFDMNVAYALPDLPPPQCLAQIYCILPRSEAHRKLRLHTEVCSRLD
jgi:hypothetical protein